MIRTCPSCGKKNRVPAKHLADQGTCGACKAPLPPVSEPIVVDDVASFDDITRNAAVPVLIDFWAAWCGPCRMAAPEVKKTAQSQAGKALVLKVDTEDLPELAARFDVRGIPNFLLMRGGKVVMQRAGLVPHTEMERWLHQAR